MHIYLILSFQMSGVVIYSGQHGCCTCTPEHLLDCLSWWLLQVPEVVRTDYQLIDISEDGFVSLLTESGDTKDDLRLPSDDQLLAQVAF
jgi:hypothetical protein